MSIPDPIPLGYAAPMPIKRHSAFLMLIISYVIAFTTAITYVVVLTLTLPKTDGAYGQMPFHDPLVFPIMSIFATIVGTILFPFYYFAVRSKPVGKSFLIVIGVVLVELIAVTPINAGFGFLGSFVAVAVGLLLARWQPTNATALPE